MSINVSMSIIEACSTIEQITKIVNERGVKGEVFIELHGNTPVFFFGVDGSKDVVEVSIDRFCAKVLNLVSQLTDDKI